MLKNKGALFSVPSVLVVFVLLLLLGLQSVSWAASDPVYDTFLACLSKNSDSSVSSILYSQTNPSYTKVLRNYIRNRRFNTSQAPKPAIIFTPQRVTHVQAAVICAKSIGIQIKIRSGGHDYDGISYVSNTVGRFIVLDLFNLRSVEVNIADQTAWVQSGATLGELYYKIWERSNVHGFPAGVCPTVGAGGHITGGGYGNLLRKYGLSVDNMLDAQIVDVNGKILDRNGMGEELFWAIRGGGGGSFGVILSYKLKLVSVPKVVTVFRVERTLEQNATSLVHKFQSVGPSIDDDLFVRLLLQPVTRNKKKTIRASFISLFLGDAQRLVGLMNSEFPELGLQKQECMEMSWIQSVLYWGNFDNKTSPSALLNRNLNSANFLKRKSDYLQKPISIDGLNSLWKKMIELGKTGLVLNPYGGKMSQISPSETPFPHRAGNLFKIQYSVNWDEEGTQADNNFISQIRGLHSFMTPFVSNNPRGAFLNYRDLDIGTTDSGKDTYNQGKVYGVKYFLGNFDRLVKVKTMVDPTNFFTNEQSIPPSPSPSKKKRKMI